MRPLAERTRHISPSPTMKVTAMVDDLRRRGVEVIDFGAGEPDFPTPAHAKLAAHQAIDADFTKYTPNAGTAELRRAIVDRYRTDYGVAYAEHEVIASTGGKQALYNTALALFGPGDEVVAHAPYWPTLVEQVKLAGAAPIVVRTRAEDGFAIRADTILSAVTPRTRGIIINSPCNPTGALVTERDFQAIADVAASRDIWLVVDLCYEQIVYDTVPHNLPAIVERTCREVGVLCGSASKGYAMTGWRCGWTIGPAAVVAACAAIQSHATSNVSSITQKAALAALTGPQEPVREMLREYRQRRDRLHEWLTADPRVRCQSPAGAFYMFVDVREVLTPEGLPTSGGFAEALLRDAHVAVTPGEAFDAPGFVRISFATSLEHLREGSRRFLDFVRTHAPALSPES